jgi:hypothetical protein
VCTLWDIYDSYNVPEVEVRKDSLADFEQIPIKEMVGPDKSIKSDTNGNNLRAGHNIISAFIIET